MNMVVTIDTEEDNWSRRSITDNPVTNIEKLIPLQQMFDRYQIRPTYLITYPVATTPSSVEILRQFVEEGKCEIGAHCHPWNTPPFEEEITEFNSMLCNLSEDLVLEKMTTLHHAICDNFGIVPVSFRSGRWGFNSAVARSLVKLGYKVDSSVTPFVSWNEYHGPDFRNYPYRPFRFDPDNIALPSENGPLLQVPVTVGFLQGNFEICRKATMIIENDIMKKMRLKGILHKIKLLNKTWLSPEYTDADTIIKLAERVRAQGLPLLNMTFHSTSLKAGLNPFVSSSKDEMDFIEQIEKVVSFARNQHYKLWTLAQTVQAY